jgi:hypothetical protein
MSNGYIYVIEDEPHICKIGVTKNFPKLRNLQLCSESGKKLKVKGYCITDDIYKNEKFIHKILDDFRLKGEWFNLSYNEIIQGLSDLFIFKDYNEKDVDRIGYSEKLTFYIPKELSKALNDIYAKRILEDRKTDKSELVAEAVKLLIEKENKRND